MQDNVSYTPKRLIDVYMARYSIRITRRVLNYDEMYFDVSISFPYVVIPVTCCVYYTWGLSVTALNLVLLVHPLL